MPKIQTLVATPYAEDLVLCQKFIDRMDDLEIVGHAPRLMELFSKVEQNPPGLVLISSELCEESDFQVIVSIFKTLDVRWAKFESIASGNRRIQSSRGSDLFSLKLDCDLTTFSTQLRAVMLAKQSARQSPLPTKHTRPKRYNRMVLIGSSTGGVEALQTVLSHFDNECPPTVLVQHTGQGFGSGLAAVISRASSARIKMFEPNIKIESGTVYIVAGHSQHVVMSGSTQPYLMTSKGPPVSGHTPSIDTLFSSAVPFAPRVAAAILTGMGHDGANGLLALRNAGARTIAQDEKTSVVYGMPAYAWSNGGAMKQVGLDNIGPSLLAAASR